MLNPQSIVTLDSGCIQIAKTIIAIVTRKRSKLRGDDMKRTIFSTVAAMLALAATSVNAGDVESIMADCDGCHGPGGVSESSDVPTIAGFPEFVHVDALYVYQDEARPCAESAYRHGDTSKPATTMCAVAAELSEDDIDAIAAASFLLRCAS